MLQVGVGRLEEVGMIVVGLLEGVDGRWRRVVERGVVGVVGENRLLLLVLGLTHCSLVSLPVLVALLNAHSPDLLLLL